MNKPSLFYLFQNFNKKESRLTTFLYFFIFVICFLISSQIFSLRFRQLMLSQKHLRLESFLKWAVLQSVPSMYSFENTFYFQDKKFTVNHYPLSYITFHNKRAVLFEVYKTQEIDVQSSYLGSSLLTHYQLVPSPDGYLIREKTE